MNINCVICSDLFIPTAEIFVTKCGHMFHHACIMNWLERSKSCPQCRNKATEHSIHRIYFNLANVDTEHDVGALVNKVDSLHFQITLKERDLKNYKDKVEKYKIQNMGLRQEVANLEQTTRAQESALHAVKDRISFFKSKAKQADRLSEEIMTLKLTMKTMENLQLVIDGTREQVNDILRNENNTESLAIYAAMLKKSLIDTDLKKKETEFSLKRAQHEAHKYKKEYHNLQSKNSEMRRELEQLKTTFEQEKKYLKNKIADLIQKMSCKEDRDISNTSLLRVTCESPVNFNRTPQLTSPNENDNVNFESDATVKHHQNHESSSPYLPIKSSAVCMDYNKFLNTKFVTPSSNSKPDYSIFKPSGTRIENLSLSKNGGVNYDGLGGTSKEDIFPSPKPISTGLKRPKSSTSISSNKFRKLAPSKTKLTDFLKDNHSQ